MQSFQCNIFLAMTIFAWRILCSYLSIYLTNNALLRWASQQKSLSSIAWSIRWKVSFAQNRSFDLGPFFSGHWINFTRQLGKKSFRCGQHQSFPRNWHLKEHVTILSESESDIFGPLPRTFRKLDYYRQLHWPLICQKLYVSHDIYYII